mmetsp:Transcript_77295/g.244216  ORF Transcript_77295/g.244216 Transcript_77295/m.244216 type:complete len:248 (+) Transcript_77295:784-1527(+)
MLATSKRHPPTSTDPAVSPAKLLTPWKRKTVWGHCHRSTPTDSLRPALRRCVRWSAPWFRTPSSLDWRPSYSCPRPSHRNCSPWQPHALATEVLMASRGCPWARTWRPQWAPPSPWRRTPGCMGKLLVRLALPRPFLVLLPPLRPTPRWSGWTVALSSSRQPTGSGSLTRRCSRQTRSSFPEVMEEQRHLHDADCHPRPPMEPAWGFSPPWPVPTRSREAVLLRARPPAARSLRSLAHRRSASVWPP